MHVSRRATSHPAGTRDGSITVTAKKVKDEAVIVVQDTGIGMTPDLVARVFDLFVQGERRLARSEGGLGVGLTLVKRLVEMQGGSVEATSAGPNQGSRFSIRVPATVMQPKTIRPNARTARTTTSGHRVLIVEDNADVRDMFRVLLEVDGHEVHEAEDEPTAALAAPPDVAFIDIGLPSMDGYELVQHIRTRAEGPLPILVVLPGYGRSENRQRMEVAGVPRTPHQAGTTQTASARSCTVRRIA